MLAGVAVNALDGGCGLDS